MFEKSDDKIRATRNLNRNKDMIDNQLKKSERYERNDRPNRNR